MLTSEPYLNKNARTIQEYIADRYLHVYGCINYVLNDPEKVVTHLLCDRYTLSTAAYQSVDYADALRILDLQRDFPVPNLTILLTASIDTLEKRLYAREKDGIPKRGFDSASRAFKERVQTTYIHLAQDYPNVHIFNAEQPLEVLAESILTLILSLSEKTSDVS